MTGRHSPPGAYGPDKAATLSLEILDHIMTFIEDQNDLFAAMQACRVFYDAGVKPLAGMRAKLLYPKDLRSLHEFTGRYPASLTALHDLNPCWWGGVTQDQAGQLKDLVVGAQSHLTRLNLPSLRRLDAQDGFCKVVASLTSLEYLRAESDRSGALCFILSQMRSPLTDIHLSLSSKNDDDPTPYLANFALTLELLGLTGISLPPTDVRYSQLVHLGMSDMPTPTLSVLMAAFPNLERLALAGVEYATGTTLTMHDEVEPRNQNIVFQDQGHSWPYLEELSGDVYTLYALGVQQEVEHVRVYEHIYNEDTLYWLVSLLPPLRPEILELGLVDTAGILALAFSEGCDNVIELDLTVHFSAERDFAAAWDDLISGLRCCGALRILHLKFGVDREYVFEGGNEEKLEATLECLEELSPEELSRRVVSALPHLERVHISIDHSQANRL